MGKSNMHKPTYQRAAQPAALSEHYRNQEPSYRLRILADYPGLIDYLHYNNSGLISSAFTQIDLHNRKAVFEENLASSLETSPKYQTIVIFL